jgi:hypothetical protein
MMARSAAVVGVVVIAYGVPFGVGSVLVNSGGSGGGSVWTML